MKSLFGLLLLILPVSSHAGNGSGGTGPRPTMEAFETIRPEILFSLGQEDKVFKFAHGTLVNNKWEIQDVEVLASDLNDQPEVLEAFEKSQADKNWAQIK